MQRVGVLRGAPEAAGELWPVPGADGAADGWRLEVAHVECGRTGLPKQIGGGENKVSASSRLSTGSQALVLRHTQAMGRVGVKGEDGQLQQTSRST
jgi:hypothetical protein